jgi:hypothetical protein
MEKIKVFFHAHPVESALLAGVALIALYFAFKPAPASNSGQSADEAALQNSYFQAEAIQAQSNSAVSVAQITANQNVALGTLAANTSTANATTYANEDEAVTNSNNAAATAAYPYETENNLIASLSSIAGQTQTTSSHSSGFFGIGGGSSTNTTSTQGAVNAENYLNELANSLYASNG